MYRTNTEGDLYREIGHGNTRKQMRYTISMKETLSLSLHSPSELAPKKQLEGSDTLTLLTIALAAILLKELQKKRRSRL